LFAGSFSVPTHVDPDMPLKTAPKKLVLRQGGGRHQAGSSSRRRRERPGVLKDWNVFSISFKGVFALWAVITEYQRMKSQFSQKKKIEFRKKSNEKQALF